MSTSNCNVTSWQSESLGCSNASRDKLQGEKEKEKEANFKWSKFSHVFLCQHYPLPFPLSLFFFFAFSMTALPHPRLLSAKTALIILDGANSRKKKRKKKCFNNSGAKQNVRVIKRLKGSGPDRLVLLLSQPLTLWKISAGKIPRTIVVHLSSLWHKFSVL